MFYLVTAYVTVGVIIAAYVLYLGNRQRQLEQELNELQESLQSKKK